MSLQIGQQLGSCEILGLLGTGGMGEAYRGRDTKPGRDVAVKALGGFVHGDVKPSNLSSAKPQDP